MLLHERHNNQLGNPVAALEHEGFLAVVDERRMYLSPIARIEHARRIRQSDAVLHGQPGPGRDQADVSLRNRHRNTGRNETPLTGLERTVLGRIQIDAGIPHGGVFGEREIGIELLDEYLQTVHANSNRTGVHW